MHASADIPSRTSCRCWRFGHLLRWLPLLLLAVVVGCGEANPVKDLYDAGAEIEFRDPLVRETVTQIDFPRETDDELVALLDGETFSEIQEIDLSNTQITNEALKTIGELTTLRSLNLSNTAIDDDGLKHLQNLANLQQLYLGDTLVTGDGLKYLHGLETLSTLSLVGKPKPEQPQERNWQTAIRLGIDLAGGTNLVYQVVPTEEKDITPEAMDQMVGAVKRRLDPAGTEEITVRKIGSDRIEVIIPQADPEVVAEKKRMMTRLGTLEFALLANTLSHQNIIDRIRAEGGRDLRDEDGHIIAGWREVAVDAEGDPKDIGTHGRVVNRPSPTNPEVTEYLVVFGPPDQRIVGKYLKRADATTDNSGRPAVGFQFDTRGATLFASLTGRHLPTSEGGFQHRLAILLDEKIHSAPQIRSQIQGRGIIEGEFTLEEVDELVSVLNAGALALPFKTGPDGKPTPISEQTISPLLGADVQEKGKFAITVAAVVVLVFMLIYYLFAGFVADLCLVLNLVLVLGAMAFIDAAFTLPGIAGIVLTIGMAVDANVLIFERMREERNRGSSLRMSIQNGFGRAFTTIVDANLTTLITAVVLYMIGTDQVRGFAVTLFIGIVMSMFSALYFGRLIFDICERKRWIRDVKMNSIVGKTNWDFLSKKSICAVVSVLLISAGLVGAYTRGGELLDIDLAGGSMVTVEFKQSQEVNDLRRVLSTSSVLADGLTIEELTLRTVEGDEQSGTRFNIRGKEKDPQKFKRAIYKTLHEADARTYAMRQVRITQFDESMVQSIADPTSKSKNGTNGKDSPDSKNGKAAKNKEDTPSPSPQAPEEFYGGHQVLLTLSGDGMKVSTLERYVADHLIDVGQSSSDETAANRGKYSDADQLLQVVGIEKSDAAIGRGEEAKFQSVRLYARKEVEQTDLMAALNNLKQELDTTPIFPQVNNFDSSVASDMQRSAVMAMLFSLVAIIAYIWFRFQRATFGIAAVAALVHDVLIVLGMVALAGFSGNPWLDFKINLPMIAAFLTIVGYSLNDTIVVFDRVREVRGKNPALTEEMVNTSLNQTLARTVLTSLTTFIVVGILYGWGGEGIRGFAFCLVLGVIVGTYSSMYVASPVLLWLLNRPGSRTAQATAAVRSR